MSGYILAAAAIILVCLLLSKLSGRMGVPTLALFILLGMLVGSDGLLKIHGSRPSSLCSLPPKV